ncbi:hypothetical protein OAG71_01205 [bacterium]|nr:hypothetical protein [bacterium]
MLDYFDQNNRSDEKTVLIVDDNQELCVQLAGQTRAMGLSSLTANDAISAVKIMERQMPDLLIFDSELPAGEEKTFLERLGGSSRSCEIPAIVLCKNADLSSITRDPTLIAYYVHKSEEAWDKIETFIHELVDLNVNSANEPPKNENYLNPNDGVNQ